MSFSPSPVEFPLDPRARVLDLLRLHGWNSTSFQVLERGFSYWFDGEADACVAYVDTGSAWVAGGAPIASSGDLTASGARFMSAARGAGKRACFFAVEDRFARSRGIASMPIGEQPSWDPVQWDTVVASDRKLREQLRRARAKGVVVRALSAEDFASNNAPLRAQIDGLVAEWLATRKMAPLGFLVDVQPFEFADERRYFVAERGDEIVGFLVAIPVYCRQGWFFEDLLRVGDAPNGTTELLFDKAMRAVAFERSRYVTLGLAPLAGNVRGLLRLARMCSAGFYDFDGVRRFKAKLRPHAWTPIHLAWRDGESPEAALWDALAAFTMRSRDGHDRASFVRFGFETLTHTTSRLWEGLSRLCQLLATRSIIGAATHPLKR